MKSEQESKIETMISRMVAEIMRLAYLRSIAGNDVFVNYSPHVNQISVGIHAGKWRQDNTDYISRETYLSLDEDGLRGAETLIKVLQRGKVTLTAKFEKIGEDVASYVETDNELKGEFDALMTELKPKEDTDGEG